MAEMNTQVLSDRELLESISYRLGKIERREKARVAKNWIITLVIVALLVTAAIILVPKVQAAVEYCSRIAAKADEIVEMVESVDLEKVRDLIDGLESVDPERLSEIIEQVSAIDFNALAEKINTIASIDLSTILPQINKILGSLNKIASIF